MRAVFQRRAEHQGREVSYACISIRAICALFFQEAREDADVKLTIASAARLRTLALTSTPNPTCRYSRGLRQRAASLFRAAPGFTLVDGRTASYHEDLCDAVFCLSFLGAGWSPRTVDAVMHGCIPIIVQPQTLQV